MNPPIPSKFLRLALAWTLLAVVTGTATGQDSFQAEVVAVEQGDRIRLSTPDGEQSYTLYGVICEPPRTPVGQQAKRYVERRTEGTTLDVRLRGSIAGVPQIEVVLPDGSVLNHGLLAAGLARLDRAHVADDEDYQTLELDARVAQIGVWRPGQEDDRVIAETPSQPAPSDLSPLDQFKRVRKIQELAEFEMALYRWARLSETQRERERLVALRDQERAERNAMIREEKSKAYLAELDEEYTALENERASIEETLDTIREQEEQAVSDLYRNDSDLRARQMRYDEVVAGLELATEEYGPESAQYYFYLEEVEIQEVLLDRELERVAADERRLRARYADQRAGLAEQLDRVESDLGDLEREIDRAENDLGKTLTRNMRRTGAQSAQFTLVNRLDEAMAEGYEPRLTRTNVLTLDGTGERTSPSFDISTPVWTVSVVSIGQPERGVDVLVLSQATNAPVAKITAERPEYRRFVVVKDPGTYTFRVTASETHKWRVDVDEISVPPGLFSDER